MGELLRFGPESAAFAVFSLDLDHFKSVNDTLGHPIGDRLLQAAAARMLHCVRETDMVARLGGDEFAILQVASDKPADISVLASRLIDTVGGHTSSTASKSWWGRASVSLLRLLMALIRIN